MSIRTFVFLAGFLFYFHLYAQTSNPIRLNEHFHEIDPSDSLHHHYNIIRSYSSDSVLIERTFDLDNKLVSIFRTSPKDSTYHEKRLEFYSPDGNIREKVTINLANTKFISTHYINGEQVAQVLHRGESKFSISRQLIGENVELLYNDFDPNPVESKKIFYEYLSEKVVLSTSEIPRDEQVVYIGVYIDENGLATKIEWVNPLGCEQKLAERYIKAVKSWKYGYTPARDLQGNPVGKWRYFHVHLDRFIRGPELLHTF
jgi:hypothetical protein